MKLFHLLNPILVSLTTATIFTSCKSDFSSDNYVAYFGGEVLNPVTNYVLFCKGNKVLDTIFLKKDNTFFKKFDSLTPGMYNFKHDPEFQYIYYDKNDSLMVRVNTNDFDNSVVFCGRGDQKNNYLMEMYLKNESDKEKMFDLFDTSFQTFNSFIEKSIQNNTKYYIKKKQEIEWNDDFDVYAKAILEFPYYSKKELYPVVHKIRTGKDVTKELPKDYYKFRKEINFDNKNLTDFMPYAMYLNHMFNNMAEVDTRGLSEADISLKTNINKLKIADTLIKNVAAKNMVLNNIAFQYLLEDQNVKNNQEFLKVYDQFSNDIKQKKEILEIGKSIQALTLGNKLPNVELVSSDGELVNSDAIISKKTVLFFWTSRLNSHMEGAHKKALELQKKHPNYEFIAINLDENDKLWKDALQQNNFGTIKQFHSSNFEDTRKKWAITRVHRTIIVNQDKTIKNGFTNMFEVHFENELK